MQKKQHHTVILADGNFPTHPVPLSILENAQTIVCCDGATTELVNYGKEPSAIVGDMDSISAELKERFSDRLFPSSSQETNDLTKAVNWCHSKGITDIAILGATGKREDHTIGNIYLLPLYACSTDAVIYTDHGVFSCLSQPGKIDSFIGEQISLFSTDPQAKITSENLKYPLAGRQLEMPWMGTLNESTGNTFSLSFDRGLIIIFQKYAH